MNRVTVAAELRRLATQLEWHRTLPSRGGVVTIPYEIQRELEYHENTDGTAAVFEYRLRWTVHDGDAQADLDKGAKAGQSSGESGEPRPGGNSATPR
jgi:hypothetical protein